MRKRATTNPPGRRKIITALSELMKDKDFQSITTAEIAHTAGVTEGLIYKYFSTKQELLYQVLHHHFYIFNQEIQRRLKPLELAVDRLEALVSASLESYGCNRVFARMLLLEVRSSPSYFASDAYKMVREYAGALLGIIEDGIERGELKSDTDSRLARKVILGAIEHACLKEIIFDRQLDAEKTAAEIVNMVLNGIKNV